MTTASIRKIAFVSLLLASITGASGHESADLATLPPVPPFNESESAAIMQEIKLFASARISARRAIAIAERRGARAKVIDLSFDGTTSRLAYRVKVLLNDQLWEGTIDASTGVPVGDGSTTPASRLDEADRTALAAFTAAGMDLSEAIAIAEQYGSGKAVSAGLQHDGAKLVLPVVIVSEGSLKEVSVEPGERPSRPRKASVRGKK
jgi:uncharacterized membrane protein YkoI